MKRTIGLVQSISDPLFGTNAAWGFVLYDNQGRPGVTFGYLDRKAAEDAAAHVTAALSECQSVSTRQ
jgi:hypothetical protein